MVVVDKNVNASKVSAISVDLGSFDGCLNVINQFIH